MSKLTCPGKLDAEKVAACDAAPVAIDTPKQPAPERETDAGTAKEPSVPSPPRFVFNNNTVHTTWRTQVTDGQNYIQFVVERDGFPNGAVICDRVDPDLLFKAAPTLRERVDGRQIFLPPVAWLDDDTVETLVYDLVRCTKAGSPIPVPDHVKTNPIRMIMMHCTLVFFDMEKEAEEFKEALWNLFASVNLTPLDVLWIWDTFRGRVQTESYAAPFADEYVQMMAWRILTLDAKLELDLNIRRAIELEQEPKHLTEVLETRLKTCGLNRDLTPPQAPAPPAVEPVKRTPTPTANKTPTPGVPSNDSDTTNAKKIVPSKSPSPTAAAADKGAKAGLKRPNAFNDKEHIRKLLMRDSPASEPLRDPPVWGSGTMGALRHPVAAPRAPFPAATSTQDNFGRHDPRQKTDTTSTIVSQTPSTGTAVATPSKPSIPGQSVKTPSKKPGPSTSAPANAFNLILPDKKPNTDPNSVFANRNASSMGVWGAGRPSIAAAAVHVQPGAPFNPFTGGSTQPLVQGTNGSFNQGNTFGALFEGPASNAPQASVSNVLLGSSSQGFGGFSAPSNTPATSGAWSAFSNPWAPEMNRTTSSSNIDMNFGGQAQSAGASPFPNAGFGAVDSTGAGNNMFMFQGTPGGHPTAGGAAPFGTGRRPIKRATGTRRGRF